MSCLQRKRSHHASPLKTLTTLVLATKFKVFVYGQHLFIHKQPGCKSIVTRNCENKCHFSLTTKLKRVSESKRSLDSCRLVVCSRHKTKHDPYAFFLCDKNCQKHLFFPCKIFKDMIQSIQI